MRDLAIYGAGGFGKEVACLIKRINEVKPRWKLLGFFDDGKPVGYDCGYGQVIGDIHSLNVWGKPIDIAVAIGNSQALYKVVHKIDNQRVYFPNIIAPDCNFFDKESVVMGKGNIISFGSSISCHVTFGNFNILNVGVIIGHDVRIGNYNALMSSACVSGFVEIGNLNYFGLQSAVLQQIRIGNEIVLGANSVLIRRPVSGKCYIGNPAKIFDYK